MKKIILVGVVMFLLISLVSFTQGYSASSDAIQLQVTLLSQDPDPIEPGEVVTVKFKVENEGKETKNDVLVRLLPQFPFSLYGSVAEKNIGKLRASSTGADAMIVEYKLKVDENAVEGDFGIDLEVQVGEGGILYNDNEFTINIQTQDPVLEITSISTTPEQIAPGGTAELRISVKNLADSLLKDIKFTLGFESETFPIAPYQTSSQRRIAQLQSNQQLPLQFNLIADPSAAPGMYKIPLNISYNDERGNSFSVTDVVAVLIGDTPDIKSYIKKSTVLQAGKAGTVTVEIANTGTNDIKFLELTLLPSDDFELVSTTNYVYIGDVDSDDTESEEFDIYIQKGVEKLLLPVNLKYQDANNKLSEQKFDLELKLYSSSQLKKLGVIETSYTGIYILVIILAAGGYFFYRKYWKKSKKK